MFETILNRNSNNYLSRQELYDILEELPVPIITSEKDGTIRFANKEALKLGGYGNLQGKKCTDTFCRGNECTCPLNGHSSLQNTRQQFFRKDGQAVPVVKKAKSVKIGNEFFYVQFITDLTEQEKKEKELKEIIGEKVVAETKAKNESNKFEELFEGVSEAIFVVDFDGNMIRINHNACEQLGYSREELLSMNIREIIPPELKGELKNKFEDLAEKEQIVFESVHVTKQGIRIPVEVYINIVEFDGKKMALGSTRDITIRKRFQEQLVEAKKATEHNEAELKTIFNKVPSTIIIYDENSRVQRINEKGRKKFNIGAKEVKDQLLGEVLRCSHLLSGKENCGLNENCLNCPLKNYMEETIKTGKEISKKEISIDLRGNGKEETKTMLLSTAILKSNGSRTYIAALDDITERKKMEVELISAKEKAEVSEKLKTAFLNNISHEIRTPLNGLLGFLDFFEGDISEFSEEERKHFVKIMRKSGDRLINTVTDIVEASKLDSGIVDLSKNSFSLKNTIENLCSEITEKYEDHPVEFSCHIDETLENCQFETDESKLIRVIKHLIGNAFKFTKEGSVSLEIKPENGEILFNVSDTGIGISGEDLEVIFNPFRQADINLSRAFDGNGLGLTIAGKLVKFLGSELKVLSEKDKGSSFYFSLSGITGKDEMNIQEPLHQTSDVSSLQDFSGKTILIAEDDDVNYLFLEAVLSSKGCNLIHAKNGKEAVELFHSHPEIDLIIMDLKMPVMTGIEATLNIREGNKEIPVIAHSAYVMNNEKEQSLAAGCNDYLPKPVKPAELLKTAGRYLFKNYLSN